MAADGAEVVCLEAADEADLGEVDDFGFLRGAVVQQLKRGPVLRTQAEEIDAEFDGRRGFGHGERCGGGESQKVAAGDVHLTGSIS